MAEIYEYEIDLSADTTHTRTIRLTGHGKRVLEFGCATGYVSQILTEQFGCTVTGIELNPDAAAKARLRCHRVICGDAETLDYGKELDGERFDVVLFADVLEHLKDPGAVLRKAKDFIEADGYVVASIPNIAHAAVGLELLAGGFAYRPWGLLDDTHLRFFSRRSMYELFESTGYVIAELSRATAEPSATEFQTKLAAFPPEVVEFALRQEEALTYQFIVKACPATEASARVEWRRRLEQAEADLETGRSALAAREAEAVGLRERLETTLETLAQREIAVAELRQDLETGRSALAAREAEAVGLRERLETTLQTLAQREASVSYLRRDLDTGRAVIARQEAETTNLRRDLEATQRTQIALAEEVSQLRRELGANRDTLASRSASVDQLTAELAAVRASFQSVVNSKSWKLTAPWRLLRVALSYARVIGLGRTVLWTLTLQFRKRLLLRRGLAAIEHSRLFDAAWYLSQYPDVAGTGIDPRLHYLLTGAAEGKDPSPRFNTSWYLERYPDVARAGLNPLVHYIVRGALEGRDPLPPSTKIEGGSDAPAPRAAVALPDWPGADGAGSTATTTLGEDDYRDVSQRIAAARRHQLTSLTFPPIDMISLAGRDLRAEARNLRFPRLSVPEVSILIPVYNNLTLTLECLASLLLHTEDVGYEVIVINDASTDDTGNVLPLVSNLVYLENVENLGFLRTCNIAAKSARGQYLVFLNNDVQVTSGWLRSLLDTFAQHEGVGAVGPKTLYPDGRLQEAGALINTDGSARFVGLSDDPALPRYNYVREVDYCSAVCLMLRTSCFQEIGGFDERLAPAYYEDVDLCLRLREHGLRILYNPAAVIVHHLSASANAVDPSYKLQCVARNGQQILETWLERIEALNQVRLIAFYLPQYHPIPENDRWWGKGFTEWTKVAQAKPSFEGHYQPHLPSDLGFYDLRVEEVMEEQAALAQRYGLHGFCYYYYWFSGKRLLELPLERMLVTGKPDIPFCLCWANENWTRRWDGHEREVLIGQNHSDADDEAVIRDVIRYFRHPNYIRINGRPLFLVYRVDRFPNMRRTAEIWRTVCRAEGIGEIYVASTETFQKAAQPEPPGNHGCDAVVEFPPHACACPIPVPGELLNPNFAGVVNDYRDLVLARTRREIPGYVRFGTVLPGWDNSARRRDNPYVFHRTSPGAFQAWLETVMEDTREQNCGEERIVFLNAWNEWAEGAHLEPDQRFGHEYLEAVQNALAHGVLRNTRGS